MNPYHIYIFCHHTHTITMDNLAFAALGLVKSLDDRIQLLASIDFNTIAEPECILYNHFADILDTDDPFAMADRIAQAVKAKSGLVIISGEASYCFGRYFTIMDELDCSEHLDEILLWSLKRSFKKAGFKHAKDCDESELQTLYKKVGYVGFRQP
jgi:uncharacterized protein YlaN (UPF0358 family)